jgi:hypothetical protein
VKEFQLDECNNQKSLAEACNRKGLCKVLRFPLSTMEGTKDPQMLPIILGRGRTLFTTDRRIIEQNIEHVPKDHPGIIIVKSAQPRPTLTMTIVSGIVEAFKAAFPAWNTADWSMKCLELTQIEAILSVVRTSEIRTLGSISLTSPRFADFLNDYLRQADSIILELRAGTSASLPALTREAPLREGS